jgi:hypothetical protein
VASLPLHHDALYHEKPIAAQPSTIATNTTIMKYKDMTQEDAEAETIRMKYADYDYSERLNMSTITVSFGGGTSGEGEAFEIGEC